MSNEGRAHYNLGAWKEAMVLVKEIYQVTRTFPEEEMFGLISQMKRAAVSIPSNIAEGAARMSQKEFAQFLNIARGSLSELETQVIISKDLGYIESDNNISISIDKVSRLITGLYKHVSKR